MKLNLQSLYGWYSNLIRNPKYRWWVILGTLAYLISPFDVSPDWFPIAGQIDDIFLVSVMLSEVSQMIMSSVRNKKQGKSAVDNDQKSRNSSESDNATVDVDAVSVD